MGPKDSIDRPTKSDKIEVAERLSSNTTHSTDRDDNWFRNAMFPVIIVAFYAVLSAIIIFHL